MAPRRTQSGKFVPACRKHPYNRENDVVIDDRAWAAKEPPALPAGCYRQRLAKGLTSALVEQPSVERRMDTGVSIEDSPFLVGLIQFVGTFQDAGEFVLREGSVFRLD